MTKPEIKGPLTIAGMEVENFMKVKIVRLKPDGSLIEIAGENGQGKTSLLNAIWVALGGADAFPDDPIRDGQQEAIIKLDMGEVIVTRKFRRKDGDPPYTTSLTIEAANGARFDKPQTLMNSIVGALTFEPMAFMDLDDKAKFDALRAFVPDVDFDAIEGQNRSDYEKRTDENRRAKDLAAQAAGIIIPPGEHTPIDVEATLKELEEAEAHNADRDRRAARRQRAETEIETGTKNAERLKARGEQLLREIAQLTKEADEAMAHAEDLRTRLNEAGDLPEPVDTAALRERIGQANRTNSIAKDAERKAALLAQAEQHKQASDALTEAMEARDAHVRAAIANAKMPVPGLTLEAGKVLLNGHAFDDGSTAEKLRTSIAVAMAMNPTVRVIRITKGGNDLDKKSMKIIADMAQEHGFQVWMERVEAAGTPTIIMEDGHAKA